MSTLNFICPVSGSKNILIAFLDCKTPLYKKKEMSSERHLNVVDGEAPVLEICGVWSTT